MGIRTKMLLVFLSLIIAPVIITTYISAYSAHAGMTRTATRLLGFKAEELKKFMDQQWALLVENELADRPEFVAAAQDAIVSYARSLARSDSELILAIDSDGELDFATESLDPTDTELLVLQQKARPRRPGWIEFEITAQVYVGYGFYFGPFQWYLVVADQRSAFYEEIRSIVIRVTLVALIALLAAALLIVIFSSYITGPVGRLSRTMQHIISTGDLSLEADVEYRDEIGLMAQQFNTMMQHLRTSYERAEQSARDEADARRRVAAREHETLTVLSKVAEYKDPETAAHITRVGLYARLLAREYGEDEESCELIFRAAPLHDIGKIGIPDSILLKPGALTTEEDRMVKRHTTIGYQILANADSPYLRAGATIALTHHERFDGKGYPSGLSGVSIPLFGRIVCLADVFDALTSARPYKEIWPSADAIGYVREQSGTYFDPRLVEIFLDHFEHIIRILEGLRE